MDTSTRYTTQLETALKKANAKLCRIDALIDQLDPNGSDDTMQIIKSILYA